MFKTRSFANLIAPLLLLLGAFWYFSPYLALYAIKEAARERDVDKLVGYVDLPQVRASIKQQLHFAASVNTYRGPSIDTQVAGVMAMFGNAMTDNLVDAVVTPEFVAKVLAEARVLGLKREKTHDEADADAKPSSGRVPLEWSAERKSPNRLDVAARRGADDHGVTYILEREGFASWKIVGIIFPAL